MLDSLVPHTTYLTALPKLINKFNQPVVRLSEGCFVVVFFWDQLFSLVVVFKSIDWEKKETDLGFNIAVH